MCVGSCLQSGTRTSRCDGWLAARTGEPVLNCGPGDSAVVASWRTPASCTTTRNGGKNERRRLSHRITPPFTPRERRAALSDGSCHAFPMSRTLVASWTPASAERLRDVHRFTLGRTRPPGRAAGWEYFTPRSPSRLRTSTCHVNPFSHHGTALLSNMDAFDPALERETFCRASEPFQGIPLGGGSLCCGQFQSWLSRPLQNVAFV